MNSYTTTGFQPVFSNMMAPRDSMKQRIQGDLINNICILGALAMASRYYLTWWPDNPWMAPRATKECPNYEWLVDGFDGSMGNFTTPNLPGHSCTFRSLSTSGHLAWSVPAYQATYFVPGTFLHAFLMFAPIFSRNGFNMFDFAIGVIAILSGPVLAAYLTPSLHEQASIWCFNSIVQNCFACIAIIVEKPPPITALKHEGSLDDKPMEYALVASKSSGISNGHSTNEANKKSQ